MAKNAVDDLVGCPKCAGSGRLYSLPALEALEGRYDGYPCGACGGTGDLDAYRLLRAYRVGLEDGMQAMRDAHPHFERPMNLRNLRDLVDEIPADEL